jgi:hypothetical protein
MPDTPKNEPPRHETLRRPEPTLSLHGERVSAPRKERYEEAGRPGALHILNGPVFSAYLNCWGADCSCGWWASHHSHGLVDWALNEHRIATDPATSHWRRISRSESRRRARAGLNPDRRPVPVWVHLPDVDHS